jgi:peroxiredoxin
MQQVVDLQNDKRFETMNVELLSISPDPVSAWRAEGSQLNISTPMLSDAANKVWFQYGQQDWMMMSEPGHTFVLVGKDGRVTWIRDYGAPEHGGAMYVAPAQLDQQIAAHLDRP